MLTFKSAHFQVLLSEVTGVSWMEEENSDQIEDIVKTYEEIFKDFIRSVKRTWIESPLKEPSYWEKTVIPKILMMPPTDLIDQGESFKLLLDVPGFKREDLELEVTEDNINVEAKTGKKKSVKRYLMRERRFMSFKRTVNLPEKVIPKNVKAKLEDGVLEVTLTKEMPTPKVTAHKIDIEENTLP